MVGVSVESWNVEDCRATARVLSTPWEAEFSSTSLWSPLMEVIMSSDVLLSVSSSVHLSRYSLAVSLMSFRPATNTVSMGRGFLNYGHISKKWYQCLGTCIISDTGM